MKPEIRILLAILLGLLADFYSHLLLFPLLGKAQTNITIRYVLSISTVVIVGFIIWKITANLTKERASLIIKGGWIGPSPVF